MIAPVELVQNLVKESGTYVELLLTASYDGEKALRRFDGDEAVVACRDAEQRRPERRCSFEQGLLRRRDC